jgi:N-acetylglucosaminyldiphosphoundecaprenol N-acetyl-beta-D-mannosaminyltransferase
MSAPRLELLGVPLDRCSREQALGRCEAVLRGEQPPLQVVTLNPEMVMQARRQPELAEAIRHAGLVLPDGAGVVWASRRLGAQVSERIAGVDFLEDLAELARQHRRPIFLLGARPGVAEAAGRALLNSHPGLELGGTWSGSPADSEAAAICERVRSSGAVVLAVAFGVPQQDLWLARHLEESGARVGMGVGGTLDYIAGQVPRAPAVLRRAGLEWSFRLARQPWRLPRMLRGSTFFWEVVRASRRRRSG